MLCLCSAVLLLLTNGAVLGSIAGSRPTRGVVCHFCCLLPSLCRQQRRGSPERRTSLGGGAPRGEGSRSPGHVPPSWVST